VSNVAWLTRQPTCGLADSVRVLPDVPGAHLVPVPGAAPSAIDGFVAGGGFAPDAPPPEPVGTGGSSFLWGSRSPGALTTGELTSQWYVLPALAPDEQVAVSVAGRTDGGNRLALRFGRAVGSGVRPLGEVVPPDPVPGGNDGPKYRYWRAIGVGPADVPARADRVRIEAVDATADPNGWLAVTGPRLRRVMGLAQYLDQHRPYLVAWPVAFLFPCLTDSVAVSDGLAQAPAGILEAPDQYAGLSSVTTDPASGGDFAPLRTLGHLGEETNELVGHPGADWGNVLLPHYEIARDRYQRHTEWVRVSGFRALTG
jgi:arabinosyltransferase C